MKRPGLHIALVLFFMLIIVAASAQEAVPTDQVILKLKKPSAEGYTISNKIDGINGTYHALQVTKMRLGRKSAGSIYIVKFPQGTDVSEVINAYYNTEEIDYAEPDHKGSGAGTKVTPNDTYFSRQWSLRNDGSVMVTAVAGADIDMERAWDIEQGDTNIIVGIIDSGVKLDHPEFAGRIWKNLDEIPSNGIDDDGNGRIDDIRGWNFAYSNNNPSDDYGHGTNVAGIIGSNGNNNMGYAGVDWKCKLMVLKALDNTNYGYYTWFSDAIYYAVDNGASVVNMSLGGTSSSITLQNAVNYAVNANVTIVVSMMNYNSGTPCYPAAYPGVIAVGSTDPIDDRSNPFYGNPGSGSNYGNHISVVAPGNYIYGPTYLSNNDYSYYWNGTSQAAPHVTGLASLLLAQDPSRTRAQLKSIIESTAEDMVGKPSEDVSGWDRYHGYGRINAFNALSFCNTLSLDTASACYSYTWNNKTYTASGSYFDTLPNTAGCDSIRRLDLTITYPDTIVTISGDSLIATATGAMYQWLNCSSGLSPISGATQQAFVPPTGGSYAVIVTQNGCSDTSACFVIMLTGIDEYHVTDRFTVHPNPTTGVLKVQFSREQVAYELTDMMGRTMKAGTSAGPETLIDLSEAANGIYVLKSGSITMKVVKAE